MLYKRIAKPLLFRQSPETAHHLVIRALRAAKHIPGTMPLLELMYGANQSPGLRTHLWDLTFPNPVGLAAGLDKDASGVHGFSRMGFGFVEVGTVTPKPQPGNELPRLFRLPEDEALINRMGFNNDGAERMAERLRKFRKRKVPIMVNIGKNKITDNEKAADDYRECVRKLYAYSDVLVVNISSPNTPDLRKLQHGDELRALLAAVNDEVIRQAGDAPCKPVLVKIAPDLTDEELAMMMESIIDSGVSGLIATNTTLSRDGLKNANKVEVGGLSGRPLTMRSTEIIRQAYRLSAGKLPIIGCGGIFTGRDAYDKIRAGASLVQIYTSMIYEGPGIARRINAELAQLLEADGFAHITEAIGIDA